MMLDLSFLQPKQMEPWYELHLDEHAQLNPSMRDAHFRSMLYSQKQEYNADIRLVLTERDNPSGPWYDLKSYIRCPGYQTAFQVATEVVIRNPELPDQERLVKSRDADNTPVYRPRSKLNTGQPVAQGNVLGAPKRGLDL